MKIARDQLIAAIETSHSGCQGEEGCIHAEVLAASLSELEDYATKALAGIGGINPVLSVLAAGIHLGYRLHEIVSGDAIPMTPEQKAMVN